MRSWLAGQAPNCGSHHFLNASKPVQQMDVSENSGFSPQIIHFNRVFHYFHHPFWGKHPYFWKHPNGHHSFMTLQPATTLKVLRNRTSWLRPYWVNTMANQVIEPLAISLLLATLPPHNHGSVENGMSPIWVSFQFRGNFHFHGRKGIIFEAFLAFLLDQLVWTEHPNITEHFRY